MPRSKKLAHKNIFYSVVLDFKAERFSLELHLTKYVQRYLFACYSDLKSFEDFFTDNIDLKNSFAKTVGEEVLLQPLIMYRRMRFNTMLHITFFVCKGCFRFMV